MSRQISTYCPCKGKYRGFTRLSIRVLRVQMQSAGPLGPLGIRFLVNQGADQTEQLLMLWMDGTSIKEGS